MDDPFIYLVFVSWWSLAFGLPICFLCHSQCIVGIYLDTFVKTLLYNYCMRKSFCSTVSIYFQGQIYIAVYFIFIVCVMSFIITSAFM